MAGVMNLPKGKNDRNTKCTGPVCIPYSNQEAVRNLVSYVTGTGSRTDKGEVIWYGTFGLDPNPQLAIMQIEKTQEIFGLAEQGERKAYHLLYTIPNKEFQRIGYNLDWIKQYAIQIGTTFYQRGFHNVVAIHDNYILNKYMQNFGPDEERFHFHIFVSNISMYTARRLNFTRADRWREQEQFQNAVNMAVECCPVQFNRVEIICERMYGQC